MLLFQRLVDHGIYVRCMGAGNSPNNVESGTSAVFELAHDAVAGTLTLAADGTNVRTCTGGTHRRADWEDA